MPIRFTHHAKLQMGKRKISEEEVIITLENPDEVKQGSHSKETIAIKYFGKKRIRTIYISEPLETKIIIVTH
ncbi:MAG: DUF4258 domain-containing protein [Candidatus Edwardsbacteria bacterium]